MEINKVLQHTATQPKPQIIDCEDLSSSSGEEDANYKPINPLAEDLLKKCIKLQDEISLFEKKLLQRLPPKQRSKKGNLPVELRHFKNAIQVEQRMLEALSYKSPQDEKVMHSLRSSNLKFLESVWTVAKKCNGLQVIFRTVYLLDIPADLPRPKGKEKKEIKRNKKTPVQVDIIAQSGLEWIKVANISQKRLEAEFAKARWEAEGFDDDEDDDENRSEDDAEDAVSEFQQDSDAFSLVRSARAMVQAAQQTRVQYLHPEITIVLPNLSYDSANPDTASPVHALISAILSTGARVQTSPADNFLPSTLPPASVEETINTLSRSSDPINLISESVVMDCTMLLALVSDLSHEDVAEKPIFHRYILQQVNSEREEPLLPHWVYPCISSGGGGAEGGGGGGGREMRCTFEAYKRFREIVEIVGSEREKARAEIIVRGPADWKHPHSAGTKGRKSSTTSTGSPTLTATTDPAESARRIRQLQELSKHKVPDDIRLPITVIDSLESQLVSHNEVAAKIGPELSAVNRSSLFTAWELGWTIISTNGTVIKRLEWLIEENRKRDDDVGPKVHCLAIARSLVGKMKRSEEIMTE